MVPLFVLVASVLARLPTRKEPRRKHPLISCAKGIGLPSPWNVCVLILTIRLRRVKVFDYSGVLGMISGDQRSRVSRLYDSVGLPSRITIKT
jgi:hypothetical protein